jgi:RNA polymerase sigma-70 factor (ECF subfamily)
MTAPVLDQPIDFPDRPDHTDPAHEVWLLVERAQAGDMAAFGLIYERYVDTVFRFIYFRIGNRPLAEDLCGDTFLRALKRIGGYTWQGRDLGAWLVTIARNLVADHFKGGRYRFEVTTGDVLDADREDRGPEGSPETAVVDHITNVALLMAVKRLNPEQQECIVLRFLQGYSVAETATAMHKNDGAIKALQYRAVRTLARVLPEGFFVNGETVVVTIPHSRVCRRCETRFLPSRDQPGARVCPACHADKERFGGWRALARERFGDPKDVTP